MADLCKVDKFDGSSPAYRRALIVVIAINALMFVIELAAGFASGSQALKADALDFAGDTATYGLSLVVIGASIKTRARASLAKGWSLAVMAILVLVSTIVRLSESSTPEAETMGLIGLLALLANVSSVIILLKWRDGESNVRSVWLCSRNDAIGNVSVIAAGGFVAVAGSAWPDLIVAFLLASLFLRSAYLIIRQAGGELAEAAAAGNAKA